jgi:hypothetical protein
MTCVGEKSLVPAYTQENLVQFAGVYNFGAENRLNTYETARAYCTLLGNDAEAIIVADEARFPEHERNISISMKKAAAASDGAIQFCDTLAGLKKYEANMKE